MEKPLYIDISNSSQDDNESIKEIPMSSNIEEYLSTPVSLNFVNVLVLVYRVSKYSFKPEGSDKILEGISVFYTDNINENTQDKKGFSFNKTSLPLILWDNFDELPQPLVLVYKTSSLTNKTSRPSRVIF